MQCFPDQKGPKRNDSAQWPSFLFWFVGAILNPQWSKISFAASHLTVLFLLPAGAHATVHFPCLKAQPDLPDRPKTPYTHFSFCSIPDNPSFSAQPTPRALRAEPWGRAVSSENCLQSFQMYQKAGFLYKPVLMLCRDWLHLHVPRSTLWSNRMPDIRHRYPWFWVNCLFLKIRYLVQPFSGRNDLCGQHISTLLHGFYWCGKCFKIVCTGKTVLLNIQKRLGLLFCDLFLVNKK